MSEHSPEEQLQAQQETISILRQQVNELSDFMENAITPMHWVNSEGIILWVNQAELAMLGYSREEYVGHSIAEFHVDEEVIEEMLQRLKQNETLLNYEARLRCRDGSIRHVLVNSNVYLKNGEFIHTRCVSFDITERKRIEQRFAHLQEMTQSLSEVHSMAQVAEIVTTQGAQMLGAAAGIVALLSVDRAQLEVIYMVGYSLSKQAAWQQFPADLATSPLATVVRTQQGVWIRNRAEYLRRYEIDRERSGSLEYESWAALPLLVKHEVIGVIGLSFAAPKVFDDAERQLTLALAHQCAQALERVRLYTAEQQTRDLLQNRVRLQSHIAELGQQALTSDDLAGLMRDVTAMLMQSLQVDYTKIVEWLPEKECLLLVAGAGWRPEYPIGKTTLSVGPYSHGGYTLEAKQPVIVEDLRHETRFVGPALLVDHGVVSGMSVIIQGHERPWGVLGVHTRDYRIFTQDDIYFLQSVANVLGAALEQSRLQEQARQGAIMAERHRLARDLHDSVTQTLFSASSMTEGLLRLWDQRPEKVKALLDQVHQLVRGANAELRFLLYELRPEMFERSSLPELINRLVDVTQARQPIQLTLRAQGSETPPEDVKVAIFRIAQETLNNMVKHAQATQGSVVLSSSSGSVELVIQDNGQGFDQQKRVSGMGLMGMRERAAAVGATLEITSAIGQGTTIVLRWQAPSANPQARCGDAPYND